MTTEPHEVTVSEEASRTIEDAQAANPFRAYLLLKPEDIEVPEETNVRPFSTGQGQSEKDIQEIQNLMGSMEEQGQLQPILVQKNTNPEVGAPPYKIVVGRRRREAALMHNLAASEDNQMLLKAIVVDAMKAQTAFRSAAHENLIREPISPMDQALNIRNVRKKAKLEGSKGTKKVAEYFRCSPATITQHEKLLDLTEDVQKAIHEGTVSRDAAFALVVALKDIPADKKAEVQAAILDNARNRQKQETAAASDAAAEAEVNAPKKGKGGKKSGAAGKGGVKAKHVKAAAREVAGAVTSRSKKDIIEFFEGCLGPAYGYPDGAVHQFVNNFTKWVKGEITDRTLVKYFDAMVEKAAMGTAASVPSTKPKSKK